MSSLSCGVKSAMVYGTGRFFGSRAWFARIMASRPVACSTRIPTCSEPRSCLYFSQDLNSRRLRFSLACAIVEPPMPERTSSCQSSSSSVSSSSFPGRSPPGWQTAGRRTVRHRESEALGAFGVFFQFNWIERTVGNVHGAAEYRVAVLVADGCGDTAGDAVLLAGHRHHVAYCRLVAQRANVDGSGVIGAVLAPLDFLFHRAPVNEPAPLSASSVNFMGYLRRWWSWESRRSRRSAGWWRRWLPLRWRRGRRGNQRHSRRTGTRCGLAGARSHRRHPGPQ